AAEIATGKALWRRETGQVAASGIPMADGVAYCPTGESGQLFALDVRDGATLFSHKADRMVFGSPAIAGELVLFCTSLERDSVHALDRKTGAHRWTATSDSSGGSAELSVHGDRAWVVFGDALACIDLGRGRIEWAV